ncbi:MAG: patatin-like phospholipase family protein, partial [Candidatus Nucleicultricaceae bacterium]
MFMLLKRYLFRSKNFLPIIISCKLIIPAFASSDIGSSEQSGKKNKTVVIFTIDGGGTRGILPAVMLDALQKKVGQELTPLVHMWGGTSVGGIEALMLNKPSANDPTKPAFSPQDLINLMPQEGDRIFPKSLYNSVTSLWGLWSPLYPSTGIEDVADDYFGNTYLSESLSNVIVAGFDVTRNVPVFFKSASAKNKDDSDFMMKDVARFTSSAQTYFPVASIQSKTGRVVSGIDGGNVCNNITMSAIVEARKKFPDATDWLVVNFGTGRVVKTVDYDTIQNKGALYWVLPTINITMDGVSSVVDYQLNELLPPVEMGDGYYKRRYYRFQPVIPESLSALDSVENLSALRMIAETFVQEHDAEFDAIAEELRTINGQQKRKSRVLYPTLSTPTTKREYKNIDELSASLENLSLIAHTEGGSSPDLSDSDEDSSIFTSENSSPYSTSSGDESDEALEFVQRVKSKHKM